MEAVHRTIILHLVIPLLTQKLKLTIATLRHMESLPGSAHIITITQNTITTTFSAIAKRRTKNVLSTVGNGK